MIYTEAFRPAVFRTGPDKNGFSLGAYNNFQEVFGDNPKSWFLPVHSRYVYIFMLYIVVVIKIIPKFINVITNI